MAILNNDWASHLETEFQQPYYAQLREFLKEEYRTQTIYPDMYHIYTALNLTSYAGTRVVILGQDPYHGPGQAHGLSFSVRPGVAVPPSLANMFKELRDDIGCYIPNNGFLKKWANQGVLLLNAVLTVREGLPNSHKGQGWETFTGKVIETLNRREKPIVFILWGAQAQAKLGMVDADKHFVIRSPHPSPLSAHRGFFGSRPFSRTNAFLRSIGEPEIDWQIENINESYLYDSKSV